MIIDHKLRWRNLSTVTTFSCRRQQMLLLLWSKSWKMLDRTMMPPPQQIRPHIYLRENLLLPGLVPLVVSMMRLMMSTFLLQKASGWRPVQQLKSLKKPSKLLALHRPSKLELRRQLRAFLLLIFPPTRSAKVWTNHRHPRKSNGKTVFYSIHGWQQSFCHIWLNELTFIFLCLLIYNKGLKTSIVMEYQIHYALSSRVYVHVKCKSRL